MHGLIEDPVVDVGEVHDVGHAVSGDLEVAPEQVIEKECAQVSDMREIPHRRPAGVHADMSTFEWFEDILRPRECVVKPDRHRRRVALAGCLDQGDGLRCDAFCASQGTQTLR